MKCNLSLLGFVFQFRCFRVPKLGMSGWTSRTEDNFHVLFLDWDMINPEIVMNDLEVLSEYCSHFFLFTTHEESDESGRWGNYHAICFDKFRFAEVFDLLQKTHTDTLHRDLAKKTRYRSWVLRWTAKGSRSKPRFIRFLHFNKSEREQSNAHLEFMKILHPETTETINKYEWNTDKYTKQTITHYNTLKEKKW